MASNDPPTVAAVEHSEGASYVVDFGDPLRYPLPGDTADPNGVGQTSLCLTVRGSLT